MTKPCQRCTCQRLGYVRPACVRGLTGWLDADGQRRFDALACDLDSRLFLDPVPAPPRETGHYRKGRRCVDCKRLITDHARARCRACASIVNGAQLWARRRRNLVKQGAR